MLPNPVNSFEMDQVRLRFMGSPRDRCYNLVHWPIFLIPRTMIHQPTRAAMRATDDERR